MILVDRRAAPNVDLWDGRLLVVEGERRKKEDRLISSISLFRVSLKRNAEFQFSGKKNGNYYTYTFKSSTSPKALEANFENGHRSPCAEL